MKQTWVTKQGRKIKKFPLRTAMWKMANKPRQIVSYLLAGIVVASVAGILWSYTVSAEQEVEETTYYYLQEAVFDYRVHLVPSELFQVRVLEAGRAYLTDLTDYLEVDFEYNFFGQREAELSGQYAITADLVAMTAQEEHLVWEKHYKLLPARDFSVSDSDFSAQEQIRIPVREYINFAEQVREETGYNPAELNLIINANVSMRAETLDGVITEELSPTMIIPMKGNVFTVEGTLMEEKEGGLTASRTVTSMAVNNSRAILPAIVTVAAIVLVLFRLLTVPAEGKLKPEKKELSGILKKNKERIVVTANGVSEIPRGAITVYSFDELLKLADEVGRPILYPQPKSAGAGDHFFLIYTPEQVYAYGLSEKVSTEE